MKVDVTAIFFNSIIEGGTATPPWCVSIGQGKDKKIKNDIIGLDDILSGLIYKSLQDRSVVNWSEGSKNNEYLLISLFDNIFINGSRIRGLHMLIALVREHTQSHEGRLRISLPPYAKYKSGTFQFSNKDSYQKISEILGCGDIEKGGCWFVDDITIRNQDELHLSCIVVDPKRPTKYKTSQERSFEWQKKSGAFHETLLNQSDASFQFIYYGAPGTGKSYKIKKLLEQNDIPEENIFRTTFHPDSDYSTFVGAYKPTMQKRYRYDGKVKAKYYEDDDLAGKKKDEFMVDKTIEYGFVPQAFLNAYMQSYRTDENVYLIIEEINRGNCAQIFGDLFQLLDRDENGVSEYSIKADADLRAFLEEELGKNSEGIKDGKLRLPSNLYIYATMNTSDQSLFPIDSAFKRRWDWEYVPIKYENTDWVIDIQGVKFSWVSFQKKVNQRILGDTHSEDKMLGDYFVNPRNKVIDDKVLLNKILFYLWNDVCKDGEGDIFKTSEENTVSFSDLYGEKGTDTLLAMMKYLGVSFLSEYVEEDSDEYEENYDDEAGYSINGEEKDEKGKAWGKGALVKRAVEIYCQNNPSLSAEEVRDNWKKVGFKIPHIVETDEDRKQRIANAKDPKAEKRSKEIKLSNGDFLHVSTQVGDGKKRKGFSDFLSKIQSKPEWGIKIQEL